MLAQSMLMQTRQKHQPVTSRCTVKNNLGWISRTNEMLSGKTH